MNWLEIDKFLYGLISVAKTEEQLYKDAMKKFSWTQRQAEAAIQPLQARAKIVHPKPIKKTAKLVKKRSKKLDSAVPSAKLYNTVTTDTE
tara:strand:+ start:144 stop:413 length:270 start_codon:yes stop_codon:yes gene_type:complete